MNVEEALAALGDEVIFTIKGSPDVLQRPLTEQLDLKTVVRPKGDDTQTLHLNAKIVSILAKNGIDYVYQLLTVDLDSLLPSGDKLVNPGPIRKFIENKVRRDVGEWAEHQDALLALKPEDFKGELSTHWVLHAFPNSAGKLKDLSPDVFDAFLKTDEARRTMEKFGKELQRQMIDHIFGEGWRK